jgi:hypothetical protein
MEEVSLIRIFVKKRTHDVEQDVYSFAIDIECCDVFLTDTIKEELEKLCALLLSYSPEIQVYRNIKYREPIMEFMASQLCTGNYRVSVNTSFKEQLRIVKNYDEIISLISKGIIERISYLFGAYSLNNY